MSADDTNKTPDVEAAKDEAATSDAPKKPAARKPAARKPAAKKATEKAAEKAKEAPAAKAADASTKKPAARKPAAKKPAAAKPAAAAKPKAAAEAKPAETAAAPAEKAAEVAAEPAAKKPRKPGAEPAPKAQRQAKAEKPAAEPRHGKAGVATVVDASGKELETRKLSESLFAVPADVNALHLVVRAEQAARRRGTASTKTRGDVSGSTAKLYRQKGTGRARAGSVKSPIRTGGGVAFGPKPRTYDIKVNRKVVRKALAMALSNRAENGNVYVATGLDIDEPSTARVNEFLVNLDIAVPVLVVTHDEPAIGKSVRNLHYAESAEVGALSTEQVLRTRSLVLTERAFAALNEA